MTIRQNVCHQFLDRATGRPILGGNFALEDIEGLAGPYLLLELPGGGGFYAASAVDKGIYRVLRDGVATGQEIEVAPGRLSFDALADSTVDRDLRQVIYARHFGPPCAATIEKALAWAGNTLSGKTATIVLSNDDYEYWRLEKNIAVPYYVTLDLNGNWIEYAVPDPDFPLFTLTGGSSLRNGTLCGSRQTASPKIPLVRVQPYGNARSIARVRALGLDCDARFIGIEITDALCAGSSFEQVVWTGGGQPLELHGLAPSLFHFHACFDTGSGTGTRLQNTYNGLHSGSFSGDIAGNITGSLSGPSAGTHTGPVVGAVTGNLTGDVTGNLTGNVTGNVTGDVTGNVTGDVTGNLSGQVWGSVTGALNGTDFNVGQTLDVDWINGAGALDAVAGSYARLVRLPKKGGLLQVFANYAGGASAGANVGLRFPKLNSGMLDWSGGGVCWARISSGGTAIVAGAHVEFGGVDALEAYLRLPIANPGQAGNPGAGAYPVTYGEIGASMTLRFEMLFLPAAGAVNLDV